ncbi:MAG: TonB-dependent receptor [Terracidiphilus sp.]|nr:TonB-dependent receptor [Terracidiphilus sp.]
MATAQVSRGTITGRVTDAQGAIVPGAHVVATQVATGVKSEAVSNGEGSYTIPFLVPGTYKISCVMTGFKNYLSQGAVLGANERLTADVVLQVGADTETITVTAQSPLLEQSSASTGQLLNNEDIDSMPVNGRTPLVLSQLAFGAISTANPQFNHPFDNSGPSAFSLGGSSSKHNELLMDGAPDAGADGTIAFSPPMDSVDQVKVETFQSDAAYGHTSGGTVNQVTKAGANNYHGSAYEFGQYSALNDSYWFTKSSNQKKQVTRFNQYGGSIGGPLSVPHVYDARNKVFFFFAFEGIQDNTPSPAVTSVPTKDEKNGDFSALLAQGSKYTIYDPYQATWNGKNVVRQPISYNGKANVIPAGYLNKVGQNLVSYFDTNNLPGNPDGTNNYYYAGNSTDSFDSEMARVDVNLSAKNKLFGTFRHNYRDHRGGNIFGNNATGSILIQPNEGATLDDVHIFTANVAWNNRVNWTRNVESRPLPAIGTSLTDLGFPSSLAGAVTRNAFPVVQGTNFVDYGYSKGDFKPFDSFQLFSIVNWMRGKHSFEFGGDMRLNKGGYNAFGNPTGLYKFGANGSEAWTNGPFDNSSSAGLGQQLASMLMGLPTSGSIDVNVAATTSAKYYALFVQDNWRVLPTLTLNLGVRYENDRPTIESGNKSVTGFDTTTVNPLNTAVQAAFAANPAAGVTLGTVTGGLQFAGPNSRGFYQTQSLNFSPRVGVAWTPRPKSSVRGGYGIFFDSVGRVDPLQTGFNQTTQMIASKDNYLTPYATLSNPFPDGLTQAPGSTQGLATYMGQTVSAYPTNMKAGYSERFDLDLQQELRDGILVEIGYVFNHGVHLGVNKDIDPIPASYLNVGQVRDTNVINFLSAKVSNPFAGLANGTNLNSPTVARSQLLLPYPQFTDVTLIGLPAGSSVFHEFEARVEKRMSHGVRFLANYSMSKKLDRMSYLNAQDAKPEKRISTDDRPQHLVVSASYALPFGKDKLLNPQIPGVNYVISGWNLSGIWSYQPKGSPLAWGDIIYKGTNLNNLKVTPHNVKQAFDTSLFDASNNQPVTGNHIRTLPTQVTNARQDGIDSLDISLMKACQITSRVKAQLRSDFFNATNRPQFAAPNLTPTNKAFGTITSQANLPRTIQVSLRLTF